MGYTFDDAVLGIGCITVLGLAGVAGIVYAMTQNVNSVGEISSYLLAIGGLIAALVRGKNT